MSNKQADAAKLSELRELASRATSRPWSWWTSNSFRRLSSDATGKDGDVLSATVQSDGHPDIASREDDREFIALACNLAIPLADEVERLRALLLDAERERDAEASRWQERIAKTISRAGLVPFDASGNESGDPLDWTNDQVCHALNELIEKRDEARATALLVRDREPWCIVGGPPDGEGKPTGCGDCDACRFQATIATWSPPPDDGVCEACEAMPTGQDGRAAFCRAHRT